LDKLKTTVNSVESLLTNSILQFPVIRYDTEYVIRYIYVRSKADDMANLSARHRNEKI